MSRWFFYALGSAILLSFVLGVKYLSKIESGTFGDGFVAGGFLMTCVMVLGLWLQQRQFDRQSRDDR